MKTSNDSVKLIGRPGMEPIVKQFDKNGLMALFSFAVNEQITNEAGEKEWVTQWHQVVAWGKNAALVQQKVKKGVKMSIVGKIVSRTYADKDGVAKQANEVVLFNLAVWEPEMA